MNRRILTLVWIALVVPLVGCPPRTTPVRVEPVDRDLPDVIGSVNQNALKIDRALWCNHVQVTARIRDGGREHVYHLEGSLLYRAPRGLRIDLRPGLGERVMGIGSNEEDYWVWIEPELGMMRWGRHRFAGRPCAGKMPVQPDQLASLLGLEPLPVAREGFLGPVRKTEPEDDLLAYLRLSEDGGAWLLDREYYVDRRPPFLIRMVVWYDDRGRQIVRATLEDYRPPWPNGPRIAHRVHVQWPLEGGSFTLTASSFEGRASVHPRAFARPTPADLPTGVKDIVQVDTSCEDARGAPAN